MSADVAVEVFPEESKRCSPTRSVPAARSALRNVQGKNVRSPFGVGIVDGRCLPFYWFEGPVTGGTCLEMLNTVMWPSVFAQAARSGYWFQQDDAPVHITPEVMDFLWLKFCVRLLSRRTQHHWPPYSPDLFCLDFSFCLQAYQKSIIFQKIIFNRASSNLNVCSF